MDFFQHQQKAKRRTGLLVFYFCLAIIAVVASVTGAVVVMLGFSNIELYPQHGSILFNPVIYWTALITLGVILFGCLIKSWQLRKGGSALAEMLGGRLINATSTDHAERQLLNVVEEMSIASGIPVPQVYVMDQESTINAFAAGFRPSEAIIAVTRGSLDRFSRDELQAVIGHEFSHILNADIRINLRMVAVLAGILAVGKVGEYLLHSNRRSHRSFSSRNSNNNALPVLGLALIVIGYVGLFFGRLIKAAISRQRELLADASAVQFTRNPAGLAGALIHIRNDGGSYLASRHAEDMSHMCFAPSIPMKLKQWLATHPSLDERLDALGPEWVARARARARQHTPHRPATHNTTATAEGTAGFAAGGPATMSSAPSAQVGTVQQSDMDYARRLLDNLPESIRNLTHTPDGARQVLFALVLARSQYDSAAQLDRCQIPNSADLQTLIQTLSELGAETRLPLIDMALPTLKSQSSDARGQFLSELEALCNADNHVSLFEWTLLALARQQLGEQAGRNRHTRFHRLGAVAQELQQLFSVLIWAGGTPEAQAEAQFRQFAGSMLPAARTLLPLSHCSSAKLFNAVERLADLSPLLKGPVIDCAVDLAMADGTLKTAEKELLRALSSLLECPLPPLFDRR